MKRSYSEAAVSATADGFAVRLDGRDLRTPLGKPLVVPHSALAEAIAAEWLAQAELVRPHTMPLTQLAATAIDRIGPDRPAMIEQVLGYAATDLLCYRADGPSDLVRRQDEVWGPVLAWAEASLAVRMTVTAGVLPVAQPAEALEGLRRVIAGYDDFRFSALQAAVAAMGSTILALALVEGRLGPADAFAASQLDETHQIALWGEDAEAAARRDSLRREVESVRRFLELSAPRPSSRTH